MTEQASLSAPAGAMFSSLPGINLCDIIAFFYNKCIFSDPTHIRENKLSYIGEEKSSCLTIFELFIFASVEPFLTKTIHPYIFSSQAGEES